MEDSTRLTLYRYINKIIAWPRRASIEASAEKFEAIERSAMGSNDVGGLEGARKAECCCILFWDESIGRQDEPITVTSENVCRRIAHENHADYRRPLLVGRC